MNMGDGDYLIRWADEAEGVSIKPYDAIVWIVSALYDTLSGLEDMWIRLGITTMRIALPSGVVITIWESGQLTDFRLPAKRFKAIRWFIGSDNFYFDTPLPDFNLRRIADTLLGWANIPGSESWKYKDENGTIKTGTEFSPYRRYNLFMDGFTDIEPILWIIGIAWLLNKLGIGRLVRSFFANLFNWVQKRRIRDIQEMAEDILDDLDTALIDLNTLKDGIVDLEPVVYTLTQHTARLNDILGAIGLKLSL